MGADSWHYKERLEDHHTQILFFERAKLNISREIAIEEVSLYDGIEPTLPVPHDRSSPYLVNHLKSLGGRDSPTLPESFTDQVMIKVEASLCRRGTQPPTIALVLAVVLVSALVSGLTWHSHLGKSNSSPPMTLFQSDAESLFSAP